MEDALEPKSSRPTDAAPGAEVSLDDLIDRVPAIVYVDVPDPDPQVGHRTIYLSGGVRTLLGYEPAEILADPDQWLRIVHPDDIATLLERTRRHLAEPSTLSSEYRLIRRDGRVLTVQDDCTSGIDPTTGRMASRGVITDISALRASQGSFRAFVERLPIVTYEESPQSNRPFIYIGPQIEALTGHPASAFYEDDRLYERLVHPDDRPFQLEGYGETLEPYLAEYRLIHRDGHSVWVRDQAVKEADASGAIAAIHGFLMDVSAEHAATQGLRDAEIRFRTFVEGLSITPYTEDELQDGPFLYVGPQVLELTGYSAEEFYADEWLWQRIVHPDDLARMLDGYGDPTGRYSVDYRLRRRDGRQIWIHDEAVVVPGRDGASGQIQGFFIDMTAEMEAAAALAAAEERYRTLVERLPLVTFTDTIDPAHGTDQQTVYMSPQVESLLGVPAEAFVSDRMLWRRMIHPEDVERAYDPRDPYADRAREYRMVTADGRTIWVRSASSAVTDGSGSPAFRQGYVMDISAAKQAEEALGRAQKLESLGTLAGGIAHDFNNLLVAVLGNAELARLDLPHDAPAVAAIEQIEVASRRAAELARQLLAYAGRGQFVVQPVSVNRLIEETVDLLRVAIGKDVALSLRLADELPAVEADATQLRQVIMNIVINASDAIGTRGGAIAVATSIAALDETAVGRIHGGAGLAPGQYVAIEIADTGPGMDATTAERIFDPFFTTKFAGRGLGLAAVLGIVRGHQGGIEVGTGLGRGSTFRIYLPPSNARPVDVQESAPMPDDAHGTILVVDDESAVRDVASRMLRRAGFETIAVDDGPAALARIRAQADRHPAVVPDRANGAPREVAIDAVLLDLTMPKMDGAAVLIAIHELDPRLPVVLMSGYSASDVELRLGESGPTAFVKKPFTPVELTSALQTVLRRRDRSEP